MPPVLLDVARTLSRARKRYLTGIDRVELAYIEHFLATRPDTLFFTKTRKQNLIFTADDFRPLFDLIANGGPWQDAQRNWFAKEKHHHARSVDQTFLNHATYGTRDNPLPDGLIPSDTQYINVGHNHWLQPIRSWLDQIGVRHRTYMIHDVIPLDFPQYCRPKNTRRFRRRLKAVLKDADRLIFNSSDTQAATMAWVDKWQINHPDSHVILLGADTGASIPSPTDDDQIQNHFVILGTIEPRKNHKLLFEVWRKLAAKGDPKSIPKLTIIGERGWLNQDVFAFLDSDPIAKAHFVEAGKLSDAEVVASIRSAQALLFPSFAEGYGYPLVEALQLGTPVICSDLPVFREIAADKPIYRQPTDVEGWCDAIENLSLLTNKRTEIRSSDLNLPSWKEHFHKLDGLIGVE